MSMRCACGLWSSNLGHRRSPVEGDRQAVFDFAPVDRLRNIGGLLMSSGISTTRVKVGPSAATLRRHDRRGVRNVGRDRREQGPFAGFAANREHMLRVIRNHAAAGLVRLPATKESVYPAPLDVSSCPSCPSTGTTSLSPRSGALGVRVSLGEQFGFRNAQFGRAPTGTIGLVMDCDTTGIEPDFALVKFKKLAAAAT